MALTFFWRCEGTTLDATHDFSASDTTATANGSPAINGTAAIIGSNGIQIDTAGEYYGFDSDTNIINRLVGSVGFWVRIQTFTADTCLWMVEGNDFANNIKLHLVGADELRLRINEEGTEVTLDTTAANLAVDTNYFITVSWDQPNNDRRIRVYNSDGTLRHETEDPATAHTAPSELAVADGLKFGEARGFGAAFYLDNCFVGTAYADADAFLTNRSITSYTQYGAGAATAAGPRVNGDLIKSKLKGLVS